MMALDTDNRYLRAYALQTDQWGVDPLQDKLAFKISQIKSFSYHTVTQDERGAPDLISYREYGFHDLWWHILTFNRVFSYRQVVEGMVLKIPSIADIQSLTTDAVMRQGQATTIKV